MLWPFSKDSCTIKSNFPSNSVWIEVKLAGNRLQLLLVFNSILPCSPTVTMTACFILDRPWRASSQRRPWCLGVSMLPNIIDFIATWITAHFGSWYQATTGNWIIHIDDLRKPRIRIRVIILLKHCWPYLKISLNTIHTLLTTSIFEIVSFMKHLSKFYVL